MTTGTRGTRNAQRKFGDLPGPLGLPLIGNLHQIRFARMHCILERWADRYGPIYCISLGRRNYAVVSEPDAIAHILGKRPHGFRRAKPLAGVAEEMGLAGVFAAEGEDWRRRRRIVASALSTARMKRFFPELAREVERLRRRWERAADHGEAIDPCRDLMRFTARVTMQFVFGVDLGAPESPGASIRHHLAAIFPVLHRRLNLPLPFWRCFRLPSDRALERALAGLKAEVRDMIRVAKERMEENPRRSVTPRNFIEASIAASGEGEPLFTDDEIFADAVTLLLAGEDTTANTLAWALHYLAQYPGHAARLRAEAEEALGTACKTWTYAQTESLQFHDAFLSEVMRLKPVAPIIGIEPNQDADILGFPIAAGTPILLLTRHAATRGERLARFDPDNPPDAIFFPFGGGPRQCPGRNFAMCEMRAVLAMVCTNFVVEAASPPEDVRERLSFTMAPENLSLRLRRRERF